MKPATLQGKQWENSGLDTGRQGEMYPMKESVSKCQGKDAILMWLVRLIISESSISELCRNEIIGNKSETWIVLKQG